VIVNYDHVWDDPRNVQSDSARIGVRLTYGASLQGLDQFGAGRASLVKFLGAPFGD